jgi:hypothetical protein
VFSGAVGVGLGFGLQKIVSNLVSGIILLADKSIKPGDVISVGEQFGSVAHIGARYTSVDTRDGREYLILYRARFFGHKFDLSGVLHGGFLPGETRLARAA